MPDYDEDPLDLLEDDGDGVIETILLLDEDQEKPLQERVGCSVIFLGISSSIALGIGVYIRNYIV